MVVVQAVLLFGSEIWVLTPRLEKSPKGFHHRAERQMAGMVSKRQPGGTWMYPPIGTALAMLVLEEIGVYTTRQQYTVVQYIAICPITDLCLAAEQKPQMYLYRQWWEHPDLDIHIRGGGRSWR